MSNLKSYIKNISNISKLHKDIKDSGFVESFEGIHQVGEAINILGSSILNETALNTLVADFVEEIDDGETLLIKDLAIGSAQEKFFKNINHKRDLDRTLQKNKVWGLPGLVTKLEYFADNEKTKKVLDIEIEYDIHENTGEILRRKTTGKYYKKNGSVTSDFKEMGWYTFTSDESRNETYQRRKNVIKGLEASTLSLLLQSAGNDGTAQAQMVSLGAQLMSALSGAINKFQLSGNSDDIVSFVSDPQNHTQFPFLTNELQPGVFVYNYIEQELNY